ncbi:MAG: glycerophosphoryl diester phosphodiesterase [Chlamydiales bacterium]|jgi:glycerophosphoryl diester phosphodiesterase
MVLISNKDYRFILTLWTCILCFTATADEGNPMLMNPKIIAHRGGANEAPENTLSAFRKAVDFGVDFLEMDVRLSKDQVPMVFHDKNLFRTTNMRSFRALSRFNLKEIKELEVGSWFSKEYTGEQIPTLQEVLSLERPKTGLMIELKVKGVSEEEDLVSAVANTIKSSGVSLETIILGSFSCTVVEKLKKHLPEANTIGIAETATELENHLLLSPKVIALKYTMATPNLINEIHSKGISVWTWTVDDASQALLLQEMGVDGLITNSPREITAVLGSNNLL